MFAATGLGGRLMHGFKRIGLWAWMLSKRLYKKATFLLILVCIPVLVFGYGSVANQDSGVVTIALSCKDPGDPVAAGIMEDLVGSSRVIRFVQYASVQEAEYAVRTGKADAAWLFRENMQQAIADFVQSKSPRDGLAEVVLRESSLILSLTHEKLGGVLFASCAKPFYLDYVRKHVPELDLLTDEELSAYYDSVNQSGELFTYGESVSPLKSGEKTQSYLHSPIRGLLAVVTVLAGLATAMYYIRDDSNGIFAWMSQGWRSFGEFGYQAISVFHVILVSEAALCLTGLQTDLWREFVVSLLFGLGCIGFSMVLRLICRSLRTLGIVLPLVVVAMIVICPVFYDLGRLRAFQYLFPPTYFVTGAYNDRMLLWAVLYNAALFAIYGILKKFKT